MRCAWETCRRVFRTHLDLWAHYKEARHPQPTGSSMDYDTCLESAARLMENPEFWKARPRVS